MALRLRHGIDLGTLALIVFFQFLTGPVASHLVARSAYRTGQTGSRGLLRDDLDPQLSDGERPGEAPRGRAGHRAPQTTAAPQTTQPTCASACFSSTPWPPGISLCTAGDRALLRAEPDQVQRPGAGRQSPATGTT